MTDIDVNLDDLDIDNEELSAEDSAHMESIAVETPVKNARKPRTKKNFQDLREKLEDKIAGSTLVMAEKGQPVCHSTKPLARLMLARKELKSILPDSHAEEGYTYISLSKLIGTVTHIAYAYGFAITECLDKGEVSASLWDIESGDLILQSGEELLPRAAYAKIQDRGAEITYTRRYVYMSLMGITVDRDNDGKIAKPNTTVVAPRGSVDSTQRTDPGLSGRVVTLSSPQTHTVEGPSTPKELHEAIEVAKASIVEVLGQPITKTPEEKKLGLLEQLAFQWKEMKRANKTHLVTEKNVLAIDKICSGEMVVKDETLSATCAHLAAKMAGK